MSTPVTTSLNSWRQISKVERVRIYRRGRVCAHPECETVLSVYNPATYCSAHMKQAPSRHRGLARAVREVACEHCGASFETANPHRRYCSDRCRMAAFARRKRAQQRALARLQQLHEANAERPVESAA